MVEIVIEQLADLELAYSTFTAVVGLAARRSYALPRFGRPDPEVVPAEGATPPETPDRQVAE